MFFLRFNHFCFVFLLHFWSCFTTTHNLFIFFQLWSAPSFPLCIVLWENSVNRQHTQKSSVFIYILFDLSILWFVTFLVWTHFLLKTCLESVCSTELGQFTRYELRYTCCAGLYLKVKLSYLSRQKSFPKYCSYLCLLNTRWFLSFMLMP